MKKNKNKKERAYSLQNFLGGARMSKSSKSKKNKVPKITEEEYVKYLSSLKDRGQVCSERQTAERAGKPVAVEMQNK